MPLILFLAGGLTLYLKPNRYESTTEFQYLGKRPQAEVEALLTSHNVIEMIVRDHELVSVFGTDMDSAIEGVSRSLETTLDPSSGMFKASVTCTMKEVARDIALSLPLALEKYEIKLATQDTNSRLEAAERSLKGMESDADDKQSFLSKIIAIRGDQTGDAISRLDVDAARRDWEYIHQRVLEGRSQVMALKRETENSGKWVTIHTRPQISHVPVDDQVDDSLGAILLHALGKGLAFALIAPYLLELAFPRRRRARVTARELGDHDLDSLEIPVRV